MALWIATVRAVGSIGCCGCSPDPPKPVGDSLLHYYPHQQPQEEASPWRLTEGQRDDRSESTNDEATAGPEQSDAERHGQAQDSTIPALWPAASDNSVVIHARTIARAVRRLELFTADDVESAREASAEGQFKRRGLDENGSMVEPSSCCDDMRAQIDHTCLEHPKPGQCPDQVVAYTPKFDEYGLWIRTGRSQQGESYLMIQFCPWCGARLPASRRDDWFDRLARMGVGDARQAPASMATYGWWLAI